MIKRPFFSLCKPKLEYEAIGDQVGSVRDISLPGQVSLLVKGCDMGSVKLSLGTPVKTGQRIELTGDPDCYVVSTVTGTISGISEYTGYMNESYASISIEVSGEDEPDEVVLADLKEPTFEVARDYLAELPGKSDFSSLLVLDPPVNTVVITCMDDDLLVLTRQQAVKSDVEGLVEGIEYLKKVTRIGRVVLVTSSALAPMVSKADADILEVSSRFPSALPGVIAKEVLGSDYTVGKSFEEMGIGFISAETVIALSRIFGKGEFSFDKLVTVIGKDNEPVLAKVRIGTLVKDVLASVGIVASQGDRLVFGGPMTGVAIYSEDMPICADTDALMVQDQSQIALSMDAQCLNCGECVRACPVNIPVNMLIRVLSSGLYEDAVDYDLHSCIECGLCNYVCVARIPVFHQIMLGKHEYARINNLEGSNA